MSVATLQQVTMTFECRGPPMPSDVNDLCVSTLTSSKKKGHDENGNVIHLRPSKMDHFSVSEGQNNPDATTEQGPKYDLADVIDQLTLTSDDDEEDDDDKELSSHGAGGTKRSNPKSSDTHEDLGTTAPKKRHHSSPPEPQPPPDDPRPPPDPRPSPNLRTLPDPRPPPNPLPGHLPVKHDTPPSTHPPPAQNNTINVDIVRSMKAQSLPPSVSEMTHAPILNTMATSVCGAPSTEPCIRPSQSSSLKEAPHTVWSIQGGEILPSSAVQNVHVSSTSSDCGRGTRDPRFECSGKARQSVSGEVVPATNPLGRQVVPTTNPLGREVVPPTNPLGRQVVPATNPLGRQVIPPTNPLGRQCLPGQFPSIGSSPTGSEDLSSDVDPDGAPVCSEEREIQRIAEYLIGHQSESLIGLEMATSDPSLYQQVEELLRSSEASVTLNSLHVTAGATLSGSESSTNVMSSLHVRVPTLPGGVGTPEPVVSVLSRESMVTRPPVNDPRHRLPGPPVNDPVHRLPGPPVNEPRHRLPGPPVNDPVHRLPGPPVNDPFHRLPRPPVNDPHHRLPRPPVNDPLHRLPGPPVNDPFHTLPGPPVNDPFLTLPGPPVNDPHHRLPRIPLNDTYSGPPTPRENDPYHGPPQKTTGPTGFGPSSGISITRTAGPPMTVSENGPQGARNIAKSTVSKTGFVTAGPPNVNRICLPGSGDFCSGTSSASACLAGGRWSSSIDSHNAPFSTLPPSLSLCHPTVIGSDQTGMSSSSSETSVEKSQTLMDVSQASFSSSLSSSHSSSSFVKPDSLCFSRNSHSFPPPAESSDHSSSCSELASAQDQPHKHSPTFPIPSAGSSGNLSGIGSQNLQGINSENLSRNQTLQGICHTGAQSSNAVLNPQMMTTHFRPQSHSFSSAAVAPVEHRTPVVSSSAYPDQTTNGGGGSSAPRSRCYSLPKQSLSSEHRAVANQLRHSCPSSSQMMNQSKTSASVDRNLPNQRSSWSGSVARSTTQQLSNQSLSSASQMIPSQVLPNFLVDQKDSSHPTYPVPVFVGKIPGMGDDGEDGGGGQEGRSLSVWFENGTLSEEVLNAVCDGNGVWLTDSEGDTLVHSLPGWEDEDKAVDALFRVKEKPNFLRALNLPNRNTETPLYSAVCLGKQRLAECMLDSGAEVNRLCCLDTVGQTALHKAVANRDVAMVTVLLRCPFINVNLTRFSDRCTPLIISLMKHAPAHPTQDHFDIIHLLLEDEKPDFFALHQRSGKTVFMLAVEAKDPRVVERMLQEAGADDARRLVNTQNKAGNSALHLAAGLRGVADTVKKEILKALVRAGGDTGLINKEKESPNDWAGRLIREVQSELT